MDEKRVAFLDAVRDNDSDEEIYVSAVGVRKEKPTRRYWFKRFIYKYMCCFT